LFNVLLILFILSLNAMLTNAHSHTFTCHAWNNQVEDSLRELLRVIIDKASRENRTATFNFKRNPMMAVTRLSVDSARVKAEPSNNRVLVVFSRPATAEDGFDSAVVAGLLKACERGHLKLGSGMPAVSDVSIAVPRCVPKEVDRGTVVRLNTIGEGNFAEVIKVSEM
jgi:hypothetical protein